MPWFKALKIRPRCIIHSPDGDGRLPFWSQFSLTLVFSADSKDDFDGRAFFFFKSDAVIVLVSQTAFR